MRSFYRLLLIVLVSCYGSLAQGEVKVSGRHIYVFFPGVDALWGSYLFVVNNSGQQPEKHSFPVMLPAETIDFQGQENLAPQEMKLGPDGKVMIEKEFPPGDIMINVGFKIPADQGQAVFSVAPLFPIESLSLFVWEDTMQVLGENLQVRKGIPFSGRNYDTFTLTSTKVGEKYSAQLLGVPEGRGRLEIIGGVLLAVLLLAGIGLAFYSRPRLPSMEEVA